MAEVLPDGRERPVPVLAGVRGRLYPMIIWPSHSRLTLFVVVALVVVAGCSKDREPQPAPTGAPSSAPVTPDRSAQAERAALDAYTGMWMAMAKAAETSNPDDPELRRYATGDALALVVGSLANDKSRGVVTKGRPTLNPTVTAVTPENAPVEASIKDCGDSTNWLKYKANGEMADKTPGGRRQITAKVKAVDGVWKVTSATVGSLGSC